MNTNGRARPKEPNVTTSFSGLAHDVIELAELQAQLFAVDVKSSTQKTRTSLILGVIGICVLLGSIPAALFALAAILIEQLEWSYTAGIAVATLLGLVLSAGFLLAAYRRFQTGLSDLQRSREELGRNITWIKSSLRRQPATGREAEPTSKVEISKPR